MSAIHQFLGRPSWFLRFSRARVFSLVVVTLIFVVGSRAADSARTFATPEEAVASLGAAVRARDDDALRALFGSGLSEIENPDRVQAAQSLAAFAAGYDAAHRIVRRSATRCVLEIGVDAWPFPVPLVQRGGNWMFDTSAGVEELLNRRIGGNELAVVRIMRACVDAQREYASRDRDGDQMLEYAQYLMSSRGMKDGLYWSRELDAEISPLGPMIAEAQVAGYAFKRRDEASERTPFHGYYFKMLLRQGPQAPGGKHGYIVNGNMINGFALVAWPAEYRQSGIMTFIVNQQGKVYQRDLGVDTARHAIRMTTYNPGPEWSISPD